MNSAILVLLLVASLVASSLGDDGEYEKVCVNRMCKTQDQCLDLNAECVPSGNWNVVNKCKCKAGYVSVPGEGADKDCHKCVNVLSCKEKEDNGCGECCDNEGTCYGATENEGCKCPPWRALIKCEWKVGVVLCTKKTMTVCYMPTGSAAANFQSQQFATEGFSNNPACCAQPDDNGECNKHGDTGNFWKVTLSLEDPLACGVRRTWKTVDKVLFLARMSVCIDDSFKVFDAACSYLTQANVVVGRLLTESSSGGQLEKMLPGPSFDVWVRTKTGVMITEEVGCPLGEEIFMKIKMLPSDYCKAITLTRCVVTNSPILGLEGATTVVVLDDGCGAEGQQMLPRYTPVVNRKSYNSSVVELGPLTALNLFKSQTLYVHCKVKLCADADDGECDIKSCAAPGAAVKRRRRAVAAVKPEVEAVVARIPLVLPREALANRPADVSEERKAAVAPRGGDETRGWSVTVLLLGLALGGVVLLVVVGLVLRWAVAKARSGGVPAPDY